MDMTWMILLPGSPGVSVLIWVLGAMILLYAARSSMHELIRFTGAAISSPLRALSRWLTVAAGEVHKRNREVLFAQARQEVEDRIEREFERASALVTRDFDAYPALQRKLLDEIARMEEDYKRCGDVPPPPPDWVEAVAALSTVKSGHEVVQKMLQELKVAVARMHDQSLEEYRRAYKTRHAILGGFLPFWRSVERAMANVEKKLDVFQTSVATVGAQMQKYQEINAQADGVARSLAASAFARLIVSAVVMVIAVGGAFVNFHLIALPMSQMLGEGDALIGGFVMSQISALVIILMEAAMGLFVMEALRITRLFPAIQNLDHTMRKRVERTAVTLLGTLAVVEGTLALTYGTVVDGQALIEPLAEAQDVAVLNDGWLAIIPTAGQMLLGFILPFALAFVAIPLESLIQSLRSVGGVVIVALMRVAAFVCRLLAHLARHGSRVLHSLYDVAIVLPLLAERAGRRMSRPQVPAVPALDVEEAKRA